MINDKVKYLKSLLLDIDEKGYLKHRESSTLEFKESFNFGNFSKYAKTIAAFANNKGGYLLFGIKDTPRKLLGIEKEKFNQIKQDKITAFLLEHFSPEIKWEMSLVKVNRKYFGFIYVYEAEEKPVICKRDKDNILKSGDIYYRYRGQSRKIDYPELKKIIQQYREKERMFWMKHIEKIAQIGPQNVALVDILRGSINTATMEKTQLIIDEKLLEDLKEKIKFIEEGHFSEIEGEPTLKVIGEVKAVEGVVIPNLDPNKDYPYLQKKMAEILNIRPYDVQVLIWKFKLKGNKRYHLEIETGSTSKTHKFSKYALEKLNKILKEIDQKTLIKYGKEYQEYLRNKKA